MHRRSFIKFSSVILPGVSFSLQGCGEGDSPAASNGANTPPLPNPIGPIPSVDEPEPDPFVKPELATDADRYIDELKHTAFLPHHKSAFTLRTDNDGEPIRATLIEVKELTDHRRPGSGNRRLPFSLVFECESPNLEHGTYTLEHGEMPKCSLYLVPIAEKDGKWHLEAILN